MERSQTGVELRPTREEDLPLLLAWRQNPEIMRYFLDGYESWEEHKRWWESGPHSFIILYQGRPVGEIHYDVVTAGNTPQVGLYIGDLTLWGKGIGGEAMAQLLSMVHQKGYFWAEASVHPRNWRSRKMFEGLRFRKVLVMKDGYILFGKNLN